MGGLPELSNCYCHPGRAGGLPVWANADKVPFPIVMDIKVALIRIDNGMPDPARQVNIGCGDDKLVAVLAYAHDPLERMFIALCLLLIPC